LLSLLSFFAGGLYFIVTNFYLDKIYQRMGIGGNKFDSDLLGRTYMWELAYNIFTENKFLGHGFGYFWVQNNSIATFHNDLLQSLTFFGIIGTCFLIVIIIKLFNSEKLNKANFLPIISHNIALKYMLLFVIIVSQVEPLILQPPAVLIIFSLLGLNSKMGFLNNG